MRIMALFGSLVTVLCLVGCSGEEGASGNAQRLVPAKAADVMNSPDFKFERTTKAGIQCYVRPLSPEMLSAIPAGSPDREYLTAGKEPYLLVPIRDNKIVELSKEESAEIAGFVIDKMIESDPELKRVLGTGGRRQ